MADVDFDDDDRPFVPADWIGKGKEYSSVPLEVLNAKHAAFTPTAQMAAMIPDGNLPVIEFAAQVLPHISSELVYGESQLWFSEDEPSTDISVLRGRSIPPIAVLKLLSKKSGQAWLSGAKSVADPRFNEGEDRFSLSTVSYWWTMAEIIEEQGLWKRGIQWLDNECRKDVDGETKLVIDNVREELKTLGWKVPLTYCRGTASTMDLAQFLSTVWLKTNNIDIMMEDLAARVASDPELKDKVIVAPLAFSDTILGVKKGAYEKQGLLRRYEREIRDEGKERIIFPVNIGNKHWVAGEMDFNTQMIGFGDSMPTLFAPPHKLIKGLQNWGEKRLENTFQWNYDALEHGVQRDGFSCGIVMGNTVERRLYPTTPIWIPRAAVVARLRYFLKYAKCQVKKKAPAVGVPPASKNAETAPSTRSRIKIADLLNPRDDSESLRISVASTGTDSSDFSESNILLSRAIWDEDDGSVEDDGGARSDDGTNMSFATSSVAGVSTDWDNMSGVEVASDGPDTFQENPGSAMDVAMDVEALPEPVAVAGKSTAGGQTTESGKAKQQSSIMGFFSLAGSKSSSTGRKKRERERGTDDGASIDSAVPTKKKVKKLAPENVGISRSAKARQAVMEKLRGGNFEIDGGEYEDWKVKCRAIDKDAEFLGDENVADVRSVRHSKCGTVIQVREPYDFTRFAAHVNNPKGCPKVKPSARMVSIKRMFTSGPSKTTSLTTIPLPVIEKPCPGITNHDNSHVDKYLRRSGAAGGGSRSLYKIAREKFNKAFSALKPKRQKEVQDVQYHERKWRNDHVNLRIFSTECKKCVQATSIAKARPCAACSALLSSKSFKKTLKKPPPDPKNTIFTNRRYQNQLIGEIYGRTVGLQGIIEQPNAKNTPCVRYAEGVLEGKFDNKVFNGLVEAMVTKVDREERGVGMRNFKYAPAYDEFCNVLRINSPAAYRAFQEDLPGRSERSFRQQEAREPRFPMDISDRNFKLAAEHLAALNYDGPVNLSCDDSKLFPSFRLYWDKEKKSHFLVGGTDGPLRVADPDEVKAVIAEAHATKATKLRLWCLTVPMPGVAPIIVAAIPIANDLKADVLLKYLIQVVNGLIDHGTKIISYACDGTQMERSVQDMFVRWADARIEHVIEDPHGKGSPIRIVTAVVRKQVICMIQDSKHALKTFRNNLFSGARLLALGSYTAIYSRIREMAFADGSPLFHRDVEKLDRQDDNAATRLFSADTLKYLADHHPEYLGEIVYLFVFGELIDAYQNRSIPHAERVKLVLRARYFLDSWMSFLAISGYNKSLYFLSREAVDIARIIIEGYLALVYIHRDNLDTVFPLLPWLHSSEACEHVFGESRRIVKDFAMLDFLYMIPKLRIKIRSAVLRAKASDSKTQASGYSHTYFDHTGLDILALSTFPNDNDIELAAAEAAEEADSLAPAQLHASLAPPLPLLPSIDLWYNSSGENESDSDSDSDADSISEAQQLQDLLDKAEVAVASGTRKRRQEILSLTSAALALTADDMIKIHTSNGNEDEIFDELVAEEHGNIQALIDSLPVLVLSEPSKPLGRGAVAPATINFDHLVDLRHRHQTVQAARGVRTRVVDRSSEKAQESSLRQQLIKKMHLALKESEQDQATGTGLERSVRWHAPAPGGRGGPGSQPSLPSGNSANAAATATAVAKKAAIKRRDVFTKAQVPNLAEVINARITILRPMRLGDYGVVWTAQGLMIGFVFGMHSKGGGKYGTHHPVTDSTNISAVSKISVQVFEQLHGNQFRAIPTATAILQTKQFGHILPDNFLCLLSAAPKVVATGLELGAEDSERFRKLSQGLSKFNAAMILFRKRGKKQGGNEVDEENDDEL
ncbi:hypothetical protein C8F04DRAFT_1350091 [Mycena alexandri]|uniref:Ubiquitin-like protease family profile domain-containing protein n=1 Tax=Mycena alexandri TaxID=1745969 RepID=A0AAD6SV31_9AGAR|nr:hypothetical protein C8F04DRAFT_1350091 [Mycena alexandri]